MKSKELLEIAKRLREAAKLQEPMARATVDMVRMLLDELKAKLVDADGDDLIRTQGAARQLQRVLTELTIEPPTIQQFKEIDNG